MEQMTLFETAATDGSRRACRPMQRRVLPRATSARAEAARKARWLRRSWRKRMIWGRRFEEDYTEWSLERSWEQYRLADALGARHDEYRAYLAALRRTVELSGGTVRAHADGSIHVE